MIVNNILETIGNTPVVRIQRLFGERHEVYLKLERSNPGGSIKDRIALSMIEAAEQAGVLGPESRIVEPTSGNTGVGLAMVAAVKGYDITLVMPESMSVERRKLMAAYGAEFVLTPREQGMNGAIKKALEMAYEDPSVWVPSQFDNPANVDIHRLTTAEEIFQDFPDGLDYIITGVGTGGHITGVAEVLKERWPDLKVFAVEPEDSPVINGGEPGPHPIQGIGAGFIPKNLHLDSIDGAVAVSADDARNFAARLALEEGVLSGLSTGASMAAVHKKLAEIEEGKRILSFNYDTGERYLSIEDLFVERKMEEGHH